MRFREAGVDPACRLSRQLVHLIGQVLGFPRHLSQHVGGMVLSNSPLCELVPIENASMPGRTVVQWDKDDLDALGILKVDCLALGMLSAIRRSLDLLRQQSGLSLTPGHDSRRRPRHIRHDSAGGHGRCVSDRVPRADEHAAPAETERVLRPGHRGGDRPPRSHPGQDGASLPATTSGQEPVEYPSEAVRDVLKKTLGVPLFQEQAMKLVVVAAGFTPGEADQLRRAMGAWRRVGIIEQFEGRLIGGMLANGYGEEYCAERVPATRRLWLLWLPGIARGFVRSRSPMFPPGSNATIRRASFLAVFLNSQPMGFYAPAQLAAETVRCHGVEVRPVDINRSDWDSTLLSVGKTTEPWRFDWVVTGQGTLPERGGVTDELVP